GAVGLSERALCQPAVQARDAAPLAGAAGWYVHSLPPLTRSMGFPMAHRTYLIALIALALSAQAMPAASPSLGSITPWGVQRGVESVINFSGARLGDAKEVLFYSPGFTVTRLEAVNDSAVKATVKVAADCRLGEHIARVRTATGISEMRTFQVGSFPTVAEKEPNSEFDKPQAIPLNVTVEGRIDSEDVDYFVVAMKKGQRLSVEIEGMRL